ncbi:hypothetical protein BH10ACT10_BH10ACT10_01920 [soil metagenome]
MSAVPPPAPLAEPRPTPAAQRTFVAGARSLTVATILIGLVNYAYSVGLTHTLDVRDFAIFGAGQALLLSAGTLSNTSVPWVLAKTLARAEAAEDRRQAVWFAVVANFGLGVVAGLVTGALALRFAPVLPAVVIGVATWLVFLASTTSGYLQGDEKFGLLGILRIGDATSKVIVGAALVLVGAGAVGALGGFAAGSLLLLAVGTVRGRGDLRPDRKALRLRGLWTSTLGIAGIQGLLSVLVTVDLVLVAILADRPREAAAYQASMILSRIPLFLAGAVSATIFPFLTRDSDERGDLVRSASRLFLNLVFPFSVALATMPHQLLDLVFPPEYDAMARLLPLTAVAGLLIGSTELLTTFYQARSAYRRSIRAQAVGLVVHVVALVVGFLVGGVVGLASGAVVGAAVSVVLLVATASPAWRRAVVPPIGLVVACAVFGGLLLLVRPHPVLWLVLALAGGLLAAWTASHRLGGTPGDRPTGDLAGDGPRLRILHLGFEDWRKPGSGGGAVRTREVNERLAVRHEVTVLVSSYRGAATRVENGVTWVPVGLPLGYWGGIITYFLFVPFVARRYRPDLLVEDFAAPIGSVLPHRWTRLPLVAVVQWLDAAGKAKQYKLPFDRVQTAGVRGHHRFVAMSDDVASDLRAIDPGAHVTVVPNGVEPAAFEEREERGADVVFLGRVEIAQKGLDLLLSALGERMGELPGRLLIAGTGPDLRSVQASVAGLEHRDRLVFLGRVEGVAKFRLLARARVVVMPSRYETFGMVAAEAMACRTPVVAFDIPSLRDVVVSGTGVLVPAFDVGAFGDAVVSLAADPARAERMGRSGRAWARRYDWDDVAAAQEAVYLRAVGADVEAGRVS